jgi:Flp pilus assembly protein TadD
MAKAVVELEKELEITPDDETVLNELRDLKEKLARKQTQSVGSVETSPTSANATSIQQDQWDLTTRGIERFRARDLTKASDLLNRAVQENPEDARTPSTGRENLIRN